MNETVYIKVRIKPYSAKEQVIEKKKDTLEIHVREPAEQNRANDRMLELLKDRFKGKILRIVKGHHSPSKIISIDTF